MSSAPRMRAARGRVADTWGRAAEEQVKARYEAAGYALLAERYRGGGGELDLVFRANEAVVFVEVKARRTRELALCAITAPQWRRLEAAALSFMGDRPEISGLDMRFDLAAVVPNSEIEVLENVRSFDEV